MPFKPSTDGHFGMQKQAENIIMLYANGQRIDEKIMSGVKSCKQKEYVAVSKKKE